VGDAKQLQEFRESKASEKVLHLIFDGTQTFSALILYRDFFTTVYNDVVVKIQYPQSEAYDDYEIVPGEPFSLLRYGYHDLAIGSDSDMNSLIDLHRSLRAEYSKSQLARELFDSFHKAQEVWTSIIRKLHISILKRIFPGSCHLCPD